MTGRSGERAADHSPTRPTTNAAKRTAKCNDSSLATSDGKLSMITIPVALLSQLGQRVDCRYFPGERCFMCAVPHDAPQELYDVVHGLVLRLAGEAP